MKRLVLALLFACGLSAAPPAPEEFFGHKIGADRTVLDWDKTVAYFQKLAQASDRVRFREIGKSTEGRPFVAVWISSPANIKNLDRYQQIQKQLADPRRTTPAAAEKLIAEGKTVVLITCSIHATEIAAAHTAVEFAYKLLTEDRPKFRAILDNTIFILVPSLNPDGMDLIAKWYRKTLGTPFEGTSPPELYQKYVGHDNNRDWYIFSQAETRATISELHNVWHPHIVYDVHQQGPYASRMFVPPWMDPIEPNIDPIIAQQCNLIGMAMASDLTAAGKTGVAVNAMYDFWTPGRHYQAYHGGLRILTESASARIASPITVKPEQIGEAALGYNPRQPSWNYLEPWKGGEWRLRDIIDYQLIAWESLLYEASVRRAGFLRNFYTIHQRAVARRSPYAFVIPARQFDPGSAKKLLETLAFGLVEIERAGAPFTAGGREYPAASYVIRMQQPYSSFAKTLLERQQYPDLRLYPGGPPKRPYDVTAHTLPLLMGVAVDTVEAPFAASLARAAKFPVELDRPRGAGVLAGSDVESWRAVNALWKSGRRVWRDTTGGDFHAAAGAGRAELKRPRIGLYKSYTAPMDEGWTRWLLEQFGFEYTSLFNRDFQTGSLRDRFDVVVFADQSAASIVSGDRKGSMPEEYVGGLGEAGIEALKRFAAAGGSVVLLNHASELAEKLGVEAKNVVGGLSNREFYSPGSILNARLDPKHPLALGLPEQITLWSQGSPAWNATAGIVARYPASDLLASGWLLGEKYLAGRAALVDAPMGQGRVVMFGMRPQYRAQSYQGFKLFFNALVY
ncbi:MAG: peptidase M14 [Acidobacteria bacterium]|nr:peptidase M14 [Acidobacteriota bacterium]